MPTAREVILQNLQTRLGINAQYSPQDVIDSAEIVLDLAIATITSKDNQINNMISDYNTAISGKNAAIAARDNAQYALLASTRREYISVLAGAAAAVFTGTAATANDAVGVGEDIITAAIVSADNIYPLP